jgi:hypothetical protein
MTNAEAIAIVVTVAMGLVALGSCGLYWIKWRELKLTTRHGAQELKSMRHMVITQLSRRVLTLAFGMSVAAGVLMLILLVLKWPSV